MDAWVACMYGIMYVSPALFVCVCVCLPHSLSHTQTCCAVEECKERTAPIIGDCKYCQTKYCANHRLPEVRAARSCACQACARALPPLQRGARRAWGLARGGALNARACAGAQVRRHEGVQGGGLQPQRGEARERALHRAQGVGRRGNGVHARFYSFAVAIGGDRSEG